MHTSNTIKELTMQTVNKQCQLAYDHRLAFHVLNSNQKKDLLQCISQAIIDQQEAIINANRKDIDKGTQNGLTTALIDRLTLNEERIEGIAHSILEIASLPDPIGDILEEWERPNGLKIKKIRVPLGVVGMIYEARPNVTADAIAIGIKTGNAMVLRGSASAYDSNKAIVSVVKANITATTATKEVNCFKYLNIYPLLYLFIC